MLFLQKHLTTDLYVQVDDLIKTAPKPKGGRPQLLSDSELTTILLWSSFTTRQKTLKDIHNWVEMYHDKDFPQFPGYKGFVAHCQRIIP